MAAVIALVVWAGWARPALAQVAQKDEPVLILLDDHKQIKVTLVDAKEVQLSPGTKGLIVWAYSAREEWQFIAPGGGWKFRRIDSGEHDTRGSLAATRGSAAGSGSEPAVVATVAID
jgi:hypothetical protein